MGRSNARFHAWMASVLIAISILLSTYNILFVSSPMRMVICTALSVFAAIIVVNFSDNMMVMAIKRTIGVILGVWICCILFAFVQGADKPLKLAELELLLYTGFITFIICYTKPPTFPIKIIFYIILAFFYYQYFILGVTSYGVNDAVSGAVNTKILLTIAITIQIIDYRDSQRIDLLAPALIVPIAIMSWNRTGFVTSVIYMMTVFFIGTRTAKKRSERIIISATLLIVIIVAVVRYSDWFSQTAMYSKIENSGFDNTARSAIWSSYFASFDIIQFIFGRAIDSSHPLVAGFTNPHNSFIKLHSHIGICAVVFIVVVLIRLCKYFRLNKFIFFLFLVLVIRCFFDMIFFFEPFDYAFYLFVFNYKNLRIKQNNVSIKLM